MHSGRSDEPDKSDTSDEEAALPEVPAIPELPEPPRLRPNLPPKPKHPSEEEPSQYQRMGIAYMIPVSLIAPIVLLTVLGAWLDSEFHRSPAFTLGGALLGVVTGFINMIRLVSRLNKD